MPKHPVLLAAMLITCFTAGTAVHAGWGRRLANTVLPSLIRRAAVSLIQKELYDVEGSPEVYDSGNQYNSSSPQPDYSEPVANIGNWRRSASRNPAQKKKPNNQRRNANQNDVTESGVNESGVSKSDTNDFGGAFGDLAPPGETAYFDEQSANAAAQAFLHGTAGQYSFTQLVNQRVFISYPLKGSVFKRQGAVKYVILHSTETASPADAKRVIQSWNNRGTRHPGAQFVVDRDGAIYGAADPDLATVHINTSKTLPGYTNDNSVGIEIVRAGKQQYTRTQLQSVTCLVAYLQQRYSVGNSNVTTHGHVQPSDRSDPVHFDLVAFGRNKAHLQKDAIAWVGNKPPVIAEAPYATPSAPTKFSTRKPTPLSRSSSRPSAKPLKISPPTNFRPTKLLSLSNQSLQSRSPFLSKQPPAPTLTAYRPAKNDATFNRSGRKQVVAHQMPPMAPDFRQWQSYQAPPLMPPGYAPSRW